MMFSNTAVAVQKLGVYKTIVVRDLSIRTITVPFNLEDELRRVENLKANGYGEAYYTAYDANRKGS